ncbi:immunity protein Imm33 domain-containing protein [Massilia aquatica]|uniref:Imm33-like domain-containing protein n=1 Tax=Massilia aquatica TaxID=2609000 RepID=A0ABX0MKQ1_9BURK|nr:hypothetical protein [Massilia aquatica]NHZ44970.1 hypothetical protein [Massilia aquatica]
MDAYIGSEATLDRQVEVCEKYGSACVFPDPAMKAGLALGTFHLMPITGVRITPENGVDGWYIFGGEFSEDENFYQPVGQSHIAELLPQVLPYLALAPGYKFMIDNEGYEDVWYEPHTLE